MSTQFVQWRPMKERKSWPSISTCWRYWKQIQAEHCDLFRCPRRARWSLGTVWSKCHQFLLAEAACLLSLTRLNELTEPAKFYQAKNIPIVAKVSSFKARDKILSTVSFFFLNTCAVKRQWTHFFWLFAKRAATSWLFRAHTLSLLHFGITGWKLIRKST